MANLRSNPSLLNVGGLLVLTALIIGFGLLRWTGQEPFGSDNDEYILVGDALWTSGRPLVAGVESTKYPIGYPLLLRAIDAVGLPLPWSALVLNVLLIAGFVALMRHTTVSLRSPVAQFLASVYVATNVGLWGSAYFIMPDVFLTFVVALIIHWMTRQSTWRSLIVVTLLAALATSLKSVGLIVAVAVSIGLALDGRSMPRWAWLPASAGVAVTLIHVALVSPYPEHTTGYARMFWLVDPYDASLGRASPIEIALRTVTRLDSFMADVGGAVVGPHVPAVLAIPLSIGLLGSGVIGFRPQRAFTISLLALYGVGLSMWPYASVRFGLPLLPLAALGVATLVKHSLRIGPHYWLTALVAVGLGLHAYRGAERLHADAHREELYLAALHADTADAARWVQANIPERDVLASFDYRELALRLRRPVLPLGYTSDLSSLWAMSGGQGARWFIVIRTVYARRTAYANRLVAAYPDRFQSVYANRGVVIYRIDSLPNR